MVVQKITLSLSTFCLLALITGACMSNDYVSYKPVYRIEEQLVISEDSVSEELRKNIKIVFEFYKVPYKEDSQGAILIPREVWEDRDTMWNYTTKANDPDWLKTHQ